MRWGRYVFAAFWVMLYCMGGCSYIWLDADTPPSPEHSNKAFAFLILYLLGFAVVFLIANAWAHMRDYEDEDDSPV